MFVSLIDQETGGRADKMKERGLLTRVQSLPSFQIARNILSGSQFFL